MAGGNDRLCREHTESPVSSSICKSWFWEEKKESLASPFLQRVTLQEIPKHVIFQRMFWIMNVLGYVMTCTFGDLMKINHLFKKKKKKNEDLKLQDYLQCE